MRIKEKVHAETAVLYEQKVAEIRKEFEMKFDLELQRVQNQLNKEN